MNQKINVKMVRQGFGDYITNEVFFFFFVELWIHQKARMKKNRVAGVYESLCYNRDNSGCLKKNEKKGIFKKNETSVGLQFFKAIFWIN